MKAVKVRKHLEKSRLVIVKGNEVLVLQKLTDKKQYGLPGGFLEKGESPEEALLREIMEETGVQLAAQDIEYHISVTLDINEKQCLTKHYFIYSDKGQPFKLMEPHKFKDVKWLSWDKAMKQLGKTDKKIVKKLFKTVKISI